MKWCVWNYLTRVVKAHQVSSIGNQSHRCAVDPRCNTSTAKVSQVPPPTWQIPCVTLPYAPVAFFFGRNKDIQKSKVKSLKSIMLIGKNLIKPFLSVPGTVYTLSSPGALQASSPWTETPPLTWLDCKSKTVDWETPHLLQALQHWKTSSDHAKCSSTPCPKSEY